MTHRFASELGFASALLAGLCLLSGCGNAPEPEARPEPPPVEDTAVGDMVGTMDKARDVQDTVDAHKQELDRRMQEEGQ